MRTWLLDTGPLVSYLVASERDHLSVADRLDAFSGQLFTTSAVITEAMHFVAKARNGPMLLAEFVAQSGLQVLDFSGVGELAEAARRMEKYADTPMDYADATLVLLAERLGVFKLLTLDRRGFSVFRSSRGKRFTLLLDQQENS
ncbi:MAG: PIN domain-containing protein [Thermoanaerobaculia bacterium]